MSDRELIEKAAKVGGIVGQWADKGDLHHKLWGLCTFCGHGQIVMWNPLESDGDALRLAVKLQLTVCNEHVSAGAAYCTRAENEHFPQIASGTDEGDVLPEDYAATRRAIVAAAAKMVP